MANEERGGLEARVLTLEIETRALSGDVASLRASRHDHGGWLSRHNLEIQALQLNLNEYHKQRVDVLEIEVKAVLAEQDNLRSSIANLASDIRTERWKVGAIIATLVFVAQQLASRIHF